MAQIADVCNRYPNIEMEFSLDNESYVDGSVADLTVTMRRPGDMEPDELKVYSEPAYAQYYPGEKEEQWWIIVGRPKLNKLLSIKKVTNFKAVGELQVKLNFVVQRDPLDKADKVDYKIYLICDSYIGCDQEDTI
jgi:pre-mRNA-splicing helicase BRR2